MTIEQLTAALNRIPATGGINRARRAAILAQIYALMAQ